MATARLRRRPTTPKACSAASSSCAGLPVDFSLHAHGDERHAALAHLPALASGDVDPYDLTTNPIGLTITYYDEDRAVSSGG